MNMKKITAAFLAVFVLGAMTSCSKKCETCEGIADLLAQIDECYEIMNAPENSGDNEGSRKGIEAEDRLESLYNQYLTLRKHDCEMPIEHVKNKEYFWYGAKCKGTYTGDWKSFAPSGSGTYKYTSDKLFFEYTGEWEYGSPNGIGKYVTYQLSTDGNPIKNYYCIEYEGGFDDSKFSGEGTMKTPYPLNSNFGVDYMMTFSGTFSDNRLTSREEYVVYDNDGNFYDHGRLDSEWQIVQSDRMDQLEAEAKKQADDAEREMFDQFGFFIGQLFS